MVDPQAAEREDVGQSDPVGLKPTERPGPACAELPRFEFADSVGPATAAESLSADAEPVDPWLGQVLAGRYRVEALLGQGGMGLVYRATHVHMQKSVAVKLLHREMTSRSQVVARFEREAIAAGRVQHPNVARATDFGRLPDGTCYLVLDYVSGQSLRNVLAERRVLPPQLVVTWLTQMARALAAAHGQNVVHRDLKPENIIIQSGNADNSDCVKVLDFGLAKITLEAGDEESAQTQLTRNGLVFGTPKYMSPQQAAGKPVDERTDIYSLGVIGYEMVAGAPPFAGEEMLAVLSQHVHEPPPPLPRGVPFALRSLIERLLAKDPADRPQTAQALASELSTLKLDAGPLRSGRYWGAFSGAIGAGFHWLQCSVRRASPHLRSAWRPLRAQWRRVFRVASERWPQLRQLEREIAIGPLRVRGGRLLGLFLAALVLVFLLARAGSGPSEPTAPTQAPPPDEPPARTVVGAGKPASAAPLRRIKALQDIPVYERKLKHWLDLGDLQRQAGDWPESVAAYRNALQLDKRAADDPGLISTLRQAVERRKTFEMATNIAVNHLGPLGQDLIYDLWEASKGDRSLLIMREFAYKTLEISYLAKASPALRVRLELEFAKPGECEGVRRTVQRAVRHADQRSLAFLQALGSKTGCGEGQQEDCYPCIRGDNALDQALLTAQEQRPPRFTGRGYVPAP